MIFSFALVQADTEAETVIYGEHTLGVLNALGIADYTTENLSETITRGEFYVMLAKAGGYPETRTNQAYFADLNPGDDYEGYIKTLYKVGVIAPDKDGKIKAGENISATEAAALVVKILGYTPKAEALGGYPTGYLNLASSLDITDGINVSADSITKGLAAELIYNALEADIMIEIPSADKNNKEYKIEKGTNLVTTAHGMEIVEGVVDGVDISRVSGENDILPFHMEINGEELNCEDVYEPFCYLGYHVKVYHKFVRTYGDKIIYIEMTDENNEYVFNIEDIKSISDGKMEAYDYETDKLKNYRLKKAIPVVYNSVSTDAPFNYDMIKGKVGSVILLDNDSDKEADVAFVDVFENWIVSYSNKGEKLIYNKYDNTQKLVLDNEIDEPYVIIYDDSGVEIQPSKVESGDVISVYTSAPDAYQQYIRVYLSKKVVTGVIEEINDDNEITVDGTVYEVRQKCLENNANLIKVGALVQLKLDIFDYVAEIEAVATPEMKYGFLVTADVESGLGGKAKFMFYTGEEELLLADAAKNVRIDGVRYASTDEAMFAPLRAAAKYMLPNSAEDVRCSVVRYSLNAKGEVTAVDTVMHDTETPATRESIHTANNTLFAVKTASNDMYRRVSNHIMIGANIPVDNNTMVIAYPDVESDINLAYNTDEYDYLKITDTISHGDYVNAWAFYTRENQIVSDLIVTPKVDKTSSNLASAIRFVVVDKVGKMIDKKYGTEIDCLVVQTSEGEVKIPVKDGFTFTSGTADCTINDLLNGDVVRYKLDANGYLKALVLYYRPRTNETITSTGYNGSVTNDFSWIAGYVYKSYPEGFYIYTPPKGEDGKYVMDKSVLENVTIADCTFVYHSAYNNNGFKVDITQENDSHTISSISASAARSFVETGYDCSFVLVQRHSGAPYVIVEIEGLE